VPLLLEFPQSFQATSPLFPTANVHQAELLAQPIGQLGPAQLGIPLQQLTDLTDAAWFRQHTLDLILSLHAVTVDGLL
jgi:hypothetical protein